MRKETVTHNIYTFEDLPENIKQVVLEQNRYINTEYIEWYDSDFEYWTDKLQGLGYENPKINFSGFCSQGDGASFTCDIDIKKWIEQNSYDENNTLILRWWDEIELSCSIYRSNNHYCHKNTVSLEWDFYGYDLYKKPLFPFSKRVYCKIENLLEELTDGMLECARNEMIKIYHDLEKEYDYLTSDECIIETLANNEYEFNENGSIY